MPMIVLGVLSVCQLTFLPGLLVLRLARLHAIPNRAAVVFGISLVVNYLVVLGWVVLGIYTRPVVLGMFALEIAALAWVLRHELLRRIGGAEPESARTEGRRDATASFVWVAAFWLGLIGVVFAVWTYGGRFDPVFTQWDAVVSWDRWAIDWSRGILPRLTQHYPQLIPANWSFTYQFIGTSDVKGFARWFMGAFEVAIPLTLLLAGVRRRSAGYLLGSALAARLMWVLGSRGSGYVDTAVAWLGLLAVVMVLEAREADDDRQRARILVLGGLFAAAAAVTKQAGLWIAIAYPFMALAVAPRGGEPRPRRRAAAAAVFAIYAIYAVVILPWYLYKEIAIRAGADASEIGAVIGAVHGGRTYAERAWFGIGILNDALRVGPVPGALLGSLLLVAMLYGCRDRAGRWLTALVAPYLVLWMLFWSYDARNLTIALPLLGLAAGLGVQRLMLDLSGASRAGDTARPELPLPAAWYARAGGGVLARARALRPIHAVLLCVIVLALLPLKYGDERLVREAIAAQRRLGEPDLDEALYAYQAEIGFAGRVLTDYQFMGALPEIGRYYELGYSNQAEFIEHAKRPEIAYVLYCSEWARPEVAAYFHGLIARGKASRVLHGGCWEMVTTCRGPCD